MQLSAKCKRLKRESSGSGLVRSLNRLALIHNTLPIVTDIGITNVKVRIRIIVFYSYPVVVDFTILNIQLLSAVILYGRSEVLDLNIIEYGAVRACGRRQRRGLK